MKKAEKKPAATPVGDLVRVIFSKISEEKKELGREDIDGAWSAAAGESASRHGRPVSLRRTVLRVRVDSSGWMQEFAMTKRKLLKKLQMHFGKDKISDIHFRIGEPEA